MGAEEARGRLVHFLKIHFRVGKIVGTALQERILRPVQIVAVLPQAGIETGVEIRSGGRYIHDTHRFGQDGVQFVFQLRAVHRRVGAVEVGHIVSRAHAGVRAPGASHGYPFTQQGAESLFQTFLHGRSRRLDLPAAEIRSVISHINPVPHISQK